MSLKIIKYLIAIFTIFFLSIGSLCADEFNGKLISSIGISGNYPYMEYKIRRYISVRPSDTYNEELINTQCARVKRFYERQGWFNTKIWAVPEYVPEFDSIAVHVKIERGFILRYRNIDVVGTYSLPTSLVASKINTWAPYQPQKLRESIHRIAGTYASKGFPMVRVFLKEKKLDLKNHRIDVTIEINEGPYVSVQFSGNKNLGGLVLKKAITIFKEGTVDTFELEESIKAIEERYRLRGFPEAKATFKREDVSENHIRIIFFIDEGKPERIRKVDFVGNADISGNRLRKEILTKQLSLTHHGIYEPAVLANDLKRIEYYYNSNGFLKAKSNAPIISKEYEETQLLIDIPLEEGNQTIVNSITFSGDIEFSEKRLKKLVSFKPEKPLNKNIVEEEKEKIRAFYADHGYPYAEIDLKIEYAEMETMADLLFTIKSGPLVRFGPLIYVGDFLTSQKAIRKAVGIKEGQVFSYERLVNGKVGLRRLGAFASVDVDPVGMEEKATVVPLRIKVEEQRPFKLDFDIGYSTDEKFIGGIDFTDLNAFGWGKRATLELIGGRKLSRGELGWLDPKFLGYDIEFLLNGWLQYQDNVVYNYIQSGAGAGAMRRYHRTSYFVRTMLTRNYFLEGSSTAASADSLRNNLLFETSLSMAFDTRNSFSDPTRGYYVSGYSNFINEIRGKEANFVKLGLVGGIYLPFGTPLSLANETSLEGIETFGRNVSIPSNELYLLGGDNSLRGFARNSLGPTNAQGAPTGGRLRFINTTELRIPLFGNFRFIGFHDMGFLTNNFEQVSLDTLRCSAGLGLHYITPIGPIRADYGFILDRRPGEDIGRFHLTFGYNF